jgi:STIP1 family protein 1
MGLAQTALGHLSKADANLKKAYDGALKESSPSSPAICQAILTLRKRRWEMEEEKRMRNVGPLLAEVQDMFREKRDEELEKARGTLSGEELADEEKYIQETYQEKNDQTQSIFARADKKYEQQEVPDYLLDPISFNLFVDPVITKSGNTFERSWILQHLKSSSTDPFSRVPLTKDDLIPNIQLKQAAEVFIAKQGTF